MILKKCKHDYTPHKFTKCLTDEYGVTYYVYQLQCKKCGKVPLFKAKKYREKQSLFDYKMHRLYNKKQFSNTEQNENVPER